MDFNEFLDEYVKFKCYVKRTALILFYLVSLFFAYKAGFSCRANYEYNVIADYLENHSPDKSST